MEIVFLGTGGGRINLLKQIRGTGGFRINSASANIQIDPGPGALIHSLKNKQNPLEVDVIVVTHNHTDHVSDANVMIEGMTQHALKKRGILIASEVAMNYGIDKWHQERVGETYVAEFGKRKKFKTEKGENGFEIEIIKLQHDEPSTFGFKLFIDNKIIGYISDTMYLPELGQQYSGCDLIIANCIKPEADNYHGHLKTADLVEILKVARPKKCIMTHLGLKMLKAGPSKEAEKVTRESGVETIAARDGSRLLI